MKKAAVAEFLFHIIAAINQIIPKQRKVFFLCGDSMVDNTEALFRYCNDHTSLPIVAMANNIGEYRERPHAKIRKKTYSSFIYEIITSKVLVDSFINYELCTSSAQEFLQLWHGSPLKKLNPDDKLHYGKYYSYIITASSLFSKEMKTSFDVEEDKLVITGYPRNDYLFDNTERIDKIRYKQKNIIWMPTYRHGIGREETEKDLPIIDESNIMLLAAALEENDIKLFIKPHILQQNAYDQVLRTCKSDYIEIITNQQLAEVQLPLYSLIGQMDALITDYSSVYFDYLLLNRPIGFAIDDMEEYGNNRGFIFDNPLDYMPGEKLYNINDMISFVEHLANEQDDWQQERKRVNDLVNYYQDNHSCERCAEMIERLLDT